MNEDICGLCGNTGADKFPHAIHWPTEARPDSEYVHQICEEAETHRAFIEFRSNVGQAGVNLFLREVSRYA